MRRNWIYFSIVLGLLVAGLVQTRPVMAQEPQPTPSDNEVNRIAKQLFCPVCENIPLDVCPTQACAEWRELIRLKLSQGWSDDQIKEYFALQYGDRVLSEPPRKGLNWLVYILPVIFFAGGAAILVMVLRQMSSKSKLAVSASVQTSAEDNDYLKRVEEELKKHNM